VALTRCPVDACSSAARDIKNLAEIVKPACPTAPHFNGMKRKTETTGDPDMICVSRRRHDDLNIKGLYAEAHRLRDIVLRRLTAVGCEIDEKSLPKAEAIVSANIGELVAAPEYATLLDRPHGENRILALLVQSCAEEIGVKITLVAERRCRPRAWRDDPFRRKAEVYKVPCGTPLRLATQDDVTLL
jgi:hypothetical protein